MQISPTMISPGSTTPASQIEVDEHFLKPEWKYQGARRVRRAGRVRRLLERRLEEDRPHDQTTEQTMAER